MRGRLFVRRDENADLTGQVVVAFVHVRLDRVVDRRVDVVESMEDQIDQLEHRLVEDRRSGEHGVRCGTNGPTPESEPGRTVLRESAS